MKKHVIEYASGAVASEKTVTFLWDGWDLLYERHQLPSGLTILERKYLWGPDIGDGQAGGAGGLLLIRETKGNTTTDIIPLYDGTGHVIALTDINKNLLAEYAYGPFGERIHAAGPLAQTNPWRYATKYLDEETGLYYFGHRYYDTVTGQWLSREPLGESESVNLYAYCHNDPVNKVDRLGLDEVIVSGGMASYHFVTEVNGARGGWLKKLMDHVFLAKFDGSERKFAGSVVLGPLSGDNVTFANGVSIPLSDLQTMADNRSMGLVDPVERIQLLTGDLNNWISRNEGAKASKLVGTLDKIISAPFQAVAGPDALTILGGVADKHNGFSFGVDLNSRNYARGIQLGSEIDDGIQVVSVPLLLNPRNVTTVVKGGTALRVSSAERGGFNWVTNLPKGSRPHPATYMSVSERNAHVALFEQGAVRIGPTAPSGVIGRTETWVFPRSVLDDFLRKANGDVGKLEDLLGLDSGYLGLSPVVVDIPSPFRIRIPTGNEFGANLFWRSGGRTSGGIPEAVIDPVPPGFYTTRPAF